MLYYSSYNHNYSLWGLLEDNQIIKYRNTQPSMTLMSFALQTFWMCAVLMTSCVSDHTIALNTNTFSFHHYKHMCHVKPGWCCCCCRCLSKWLKVCFWVVILMLCHVMFDFHKQLLVQNNVHLRVKNVAFKSQIPCDSSSSFPQKVVNISMSKLVSVHLA